MLPTQSEINFDVYNHFKNEMNALMETFHYMLVSSCKNTNMYVN
jgi:hypothetical protein